MSIWRLGNNYENAFGALDGYVWPWKDVLKLYGELLVDDFQGDTDPVSQSVQNHAGFMLGSELRWKGQWQAFAEGGRINSFVYNHAAGPRLRYMNGAACIGSPLGPDQLLLWGEVRRQALHPWTISGLLWFRGSGERDIRLDYDNTAGTRGDPIPFGVIEWENAVWLRNVVTLYHLAAQLETGMLWYRNRGHEAGAQKRYPFVSLTLRGGVRADKREYAQGAP
jgi:hypothetical protein